VVDKGLSNVAFLINISLQICHICFRVGWQPAGLPPHDTHWRRFCTHYYFFDPAPLGGIGYCLELRSSGLANTSTSAPNVCLSEPSLFGNADLKASACAPRQSRSRQHPIPLAVRSRSGIMRVLPCKREPWDGNPCGVPSLDIPQDLEGKLDYHILGLCSNAVQRAPNAQP
jgi:hypothetical protein